MICISQVNQLGASLKVAVIPAREPHTARSSSFRFRDAVQIQKHELARVEMESMVKQRRVYRAAKRHELRFDSRKVRNRAHRVKHLLKQPPAQGLLLKLRGHVQAADEPLLCFKDIEGIASRRPAFEGHATRQRTSFHKALDQFQRSAIVPMEFVAPMPRDRKSVV